MGPIGFLAGGFAAGVAAIAIPIAIHLAYRRKAKTIDFPSLRFIVSIDRRVARRYRLQEIIVLALRCLALACVALAFARPVLSPGVASWIGAATSSRVIVIDNSLSMSARESGVSSLERSIQAATRILDRLEPGDRAAIIALAGEGGEPTALTSDREALRARLAEIRPTALGTDYVPALRAALELLAGEANARREVMLFTDAQERAVAAAHGAFDDVRHGPLGRPVVHVLVPRPPLAANLVIEELRAEATAPGKEWIEATVRDVDAEPGRSRLSIHIDGEEITAREVAVAGGGSVRVRLPLGVLAAGDHRIEARLADDSIIEDNVRRLVVRSRDELHAILARETSAPLAHQDEAFFLAHALAAGGKGGVQPAPTLAADLPSADLASTDIVFLLDIADPSPSAVATLRAFVQGGGGLAWILGGRADTDRYAAIAAEDTTFLPAIPRAAAEAGLEPFRIARTRTDHPLIAPLARTTPPVAIGDIGILEYRKLQVLDPGAEVAAWIGEGDPLLVEARCGRGRVAVLAMTLRPASTDLPLRAAMVPFVHVLARRLAGTGIAGASARVGDPLVLRYGATSAATAAELAGPFGTARTAGPRTTEAGVEIDLGALDAPGFWRLTERFPDRERTRTIAVDPDPLESERRMADPQAIRALAGGATFVPFDSPDDALPATARALSGTEIGRPLLFLALAALIAELALSNWVAFWRKRR
ncbi:MAG: VWA domain-containing protein [Planctomycetes bacterium]|nr:VWA domain-containing protein [Planctomycetota bacterium]